MPITGSHHPSCPHRGSLQPLGHGSCLCGPATTPDPAREAGRTATEAVQHALHASADALRTEARRLVGLADDLDALAGGMEQHSDPGRPQDGEPNPCGHRDMQPGCGGCDPGAVEYVIEDGTRTLRPYDPTRDLRGPVTP